MVKQIIRIVCLCYYFKSIIMQFSALEELKVPKCMSELKSKKAQKGGKTFFNIKIRAEPPPDVKW